MARPRKIVETKEEVKEETKVDMIAEIEEKKESTPKNEIIEISIPNKKERSKELLAKLIAEEAREVSGRFRNYETPGGSLRVQVRKYPGIPPFDKIMFDNETYKVPLYVARHLNGVDVSAKGCDGKIHSCSYPTHGFKWEQGQSMPRSNCSDADQGGIPVPIIGVAKWNRRFGFESLEFDTTA